jgi:hypothetical protein
LFVVWRRGCLAQRCEGALEFGGHGIEEHWSGLLGSSHEGREKSKNSEGGESQDRRAEGQRTILWHK